MSLLSGLQSGLRSGIRSGLDPSYGSATAWTVDAGSGLAFPSSDAEESAFIAANPTAGPVATYIYTMQATSGAISEVGGGPELSQNGSVTYQETVAGYARKAVGIPDGGPNTGFASTDAGLPDPSATSHMLLIVAKSLGTPAAGRGFAHISEDNQLRVDTTPRLRMLIGGDDRLVARDLDTAVHFYFISLDETANAGYAGWEDAYTNIVYTTPSSTSKRIGIGGFNAVSFGCHVLAVYAWHTTIPTRTELKARLQAHGLTVPWSP